MSKMFSKFINLFDTTDIRVHVLILVIVMSVFLYFVKEGLFGEFIFFDDVAQLSLESNEPIDDLDDSKELEDLKKAEAMALELQADELKTLENAKQ